MIKMSSRLLLCLSAGEGRSQSQGKRQESLTSGAEVSKRGRRNVSHHRAFSEAMGWQQREETSRGGAKEHLRHVEAPRHTAFQSCWWARSCVLFAESKHVEPICLRCPHPPPLSGPQIRSGCPLIKGLPDSQRCCQRYSIWLHPVRPIFSAILLIKFLAPQDVLVDLVFAVLQTTYLSLSAMLDQRKCSS
jgi:hypothetical protein